MSDEDAARALVAFLAEVGDAPEVVWAAGIAMLERAIGEAKEARFGRFRAYPDGQVRRLRTDVARGMRLVRLAAAMQNADEEVHRDLAEQLHAEAASAGRAKRRAQTLPAQLARLEKRRAAGPDGVPPGNFHLRADYPAHGLQAE